MDKIIIDFGNIVEEMKRKQVRLCLSHNKIGWFLLDSEDKLYQIEPYYYGGFWINSSKKKSISCMNLFLCL